MRSAMLGRLLAAVPLLLLLLLLLLAAPALGDTVFRCPGCTAEQLAACPKPNDDCAEIVREPGCGCCPVCGRQEGEPCGVYTPRCGSGLRCYPSSDAEMPLQDLVAGLGQCRRRMEQTVVELHDYRDTYSEYGWCGRGQLKGFGKGFAPCDRKVVILNCGLVKRYCEPSLVPKGCFQEEIYGTKPSFLKKPGKETSYRQFKETAVRHHQNEQRTRMKINQVDEPKTPRPRQSQCQQELDNVLEEISKMTFHDNRGHLDNLYDLKFPNCDKNGQYNLKQCHMSTHGQRGECWCVNPYTGIQLASSARVRGDPNCNQYYGGLELEAPISLQK